ncbi:acyltransferase [Pseudooceanicola sp.]|jgi:acetyltransferase-like isoleucine patch superfamily enzyme|uniref:acyltransferase n=1 Tax=Pseudooceanicola TaxID=1679449 RepID=UPI0035171830
MAFSVHDGGSGNRIEIAADAVAAGPVRIVVSGDRNRLRIGAGARIAGHLELRSHHGLMSIGPGCTLTGDFRLRASETRLEIGEKTTILGASLTLHEAGRIRIGRDCMFSGGILMDVSDMHSILDAATGRRLNPPRDIEIGDHVWLAQGVQVLKGVTIGAHSVIGARALVSTDIPPGCLAAGVPARVLRRGISWARDRRDWRPEAEDAPDAPGPLLL